MNNKKSIYTVWMEEKNYLVQDLANSYGDAIVFSFCMEYLSNLNGKIINII